MTTYTRPEHGDAFADGSPTDATAIIDELATGLEALEASALKLDDTVTLPDTVTKVLAVNIVDTPGDSNSAHWPDRLAFYYKGKLSGYHNEYGEVRARPGTASTVALRALGHDTPNSVDIFQVTDAAPSSVYFRVSKDSVSASVPLTAPNIGAKVTASASEPSDPAVGDVWLDLS